MGNRFVLILAACAVLFFGLLIFNKKDNGTPSADVQPTSHTEGSGQVTLVEYGDFECPGCGRFYPVVKQVKEKYGDQITFQFRHFPLIQLHPNAMAAHRAAEAAGQQGKFWEMHDMLFEGQQIWVAQTGANAEAAARTFEGYAQQLELDMEKYRQDVVSSEINSIIQADIRAGNDLRVSSTPTFFLNGTKLDDARDTLEYFSEKIDAALGAQDQQ